MAPGRAGFAGFRIQGYRVEGFRANLGIRVRGSGCYSLVGRHQGSGLGCRYTHPNNITVRLRMVHFCVPLHGASSLQVAKGRCSQDLPIVSIVVPFSGLTKSILRIPQKGLTMETLGTASTVYGLRFKV